VKLLTAKDKAALSGPDDDVTRSLDSDREWMHTTCTNCGAPATLAVPEGDSNHEMVVEPVEATLPDGTKISVVVPQAKPASTLLWECGECDTVQTVNLPTPKESE
jgi:hypothetical protein